MGPHSPVGHRQALKSQGLQQRAIELVGYSVESNTFIFVRKKGSLTKSLLLRGGEILNSLQSELLRIDVLLEHSFPYS